MSRVSRVTWPTSAAASGSRQGHVIAGLPWPLLIIRVPHCVMSGNFPVAADIMTLLRWHYHIICVSSWPSLVSPWGRMTGGEVDIVDTIQHKCSQHANNPSHLTSTIKCSDSSMIFKETFEYAVWLLGRLIQIANRNNKEILFIHLHAHLIPSAGQCQYSDIKANERFQGQSNKVFGS